MAIQKLTIYNLQDIKTKEVSIIHQNAFIFPDGRFCLAKGYTESNPSQQLEISALEISNEFIGFNIKERYAIYLQSLITKGSTLEEIDSKRLYFVRSILVHYFGYGLFARIKRIDSVEQFWDASELPDPKYCEQEATEAQAKTLKALFELNDDGTVLPNWNETSIKNQIKVKLKQK